MSALVADLDAWRAGAEQIETRAGSVAVWTDGAGAPTLLLHGFPTASWDWARVWPRLAAQRRLITLDLIGFGFSDKPRSWSYTLTDQADMVEAVCGQLGVTRVDIVAHDYSVSIAQELMARQAEGAGRLGVRSVAFLNGGLIPGEHRPRPIQHLLAGPLGPVLSRFVTREKIDAALIGVFGPNTPPTKQDLDEFWTLIEANGGRTLAHKQLRYMGERMRTRDRWIGALRTGTAPATYICGALDPVSGAHLAEALHRAAPQIVVRLLSDVGHYPQWEAPDAVVNELEAFWAGLSASPTSA